MDADNGFVLSPELRALRDQVGKIIREEIIPIEARCDPDAPEIPEDDYWRIARMCVIASVTLVIAAAPQICRWTPVCCSAPR